MNTKKFTFLTVCVMIILFGIVSIASISKVFVSKHYLVDMNGNISVYEGPISLSNIEWKHFDFNGEDTIGMPTMDGKIILSKIGDSGDVMYTYHPFQLHSHSPDLEYNVSTIFAYELPYYGIEVDRTKMQDYQIVIKIPRELGGIGSVARDMILFGIPTPKKYNHCDCD